MKTASNLILMIWLLFSISHVFGQEAPQQTEQKQGNSDAELAKKAQNPIANMYSLPFQNNTTFGVGPDNKASNTLNIQPVIPVGLGSKANLITRTIIPISTVPYAGTDGKSKTGLGDITLSLYFTPKKASKLIWGIGPVVDLPTSTDKSLGFGELNLGPSVIMLTYIGKWVCGLTANNSWSVTDNTVNKFYMQYFVNYNLPKAWFISFQPIITSNWNATEGNKWIVPFGANIGKIVRLGKQPINLQAGAYYNAIRPDNAGAWQTRFMISLLFPKK